MNKLVYGVGINDRSRPTCVDGKIVKEYTLWCGILKRCFDERAFNAMMKWVVKSPVY